MWVVMCSPLYKLNGVHTETVTLMPTHGLPCVCSHLSI